jgi:hypothetical protein
MAKETEGCNIRLPIELINEMEEIIKNNSEWAS